VGCMPHLAGHLAGRPIDGDLALAQHGWPA
jgi:hypothetical protein